MLLKETHLLALGIVCLMMLTTMTSGQITIDDCPRGSDWRTDNESCFSPFTAPGTVDWSVSLEFCENRSWELPSIHSQEENQFVLDFIIEKFVSDFWIGLSFEESFDDILTWSDGSELDYSRFLPLCIYYRHATDVVEYFTCDVPVGDGYICESPVNTSTGACDDGIPSFNGRCYAVVYYQNGGMDSWDNANAVCLLDGGELVSVSSEQEWDHVQERIVSAGQNSSYLWIGLRLGNEFPYYFWTDGTPTDYFFSPLVSTRFVLFNQNGVGSWFPLAENSGSSTVCKFVPPPPPPPIKCNSTAVKISLSPDHLEDLCVNETDKIVVSPYPFSVPGSIDFRCVSNYSIGSFYFNISDCYPDVEKYGNNLKFTWSVRKLVVAEPGKPVIRFDEDKCLELCCWYDATELVSSDEINAEIRKITVGSGSGSGSFSIEMTLYGNEDLTTELTEDDDVEVPDTIYAVIDLEIADSNERFVVQMEDCWATPSDNPCDPMQYELITEGCANKNDPGAMVEVTRNYKPNYGTFQFNSFLWVYDPEDPIYVHCKVRICDSYEYECNLTCDDVSKRDVSPREKDSKDVFSYGPIYVHSNKPSCSQDNGGCSDICSMLDNDVIVCSCPPGKSLMQDKKNCQKETEKLIDGQEMETTMMLAILLLAFVMLIISGGMMWKTNIIKANLPKQFA